MELKFLNWYSFIYKAFKIMDYTDSEDISLEKNGEDPNGYDNEYEGKKVFGQSNYLS